MNIKHLQELKKLFISCFFILFIGWILLSSCRLSDLPQNDTSDNTALAATSSIKHTIFPTSTHDSPLIPTANPFSYSVIDPEILTLAPPDMDYQGVIVLGEGWPTLHSVYLVNLQTGDKTPLPSTNMEIDHFGEWSIHVSPDYRKLSYTLTNRQEDRYLYVIDASGNIVFEKGFDSYDWAGFPGWLDNENLIIEKGQYLAEPDSLDPPLPMLQLNVNTGETYEWNDTYPDFVENMFNNTGWQGFGYTARGFDPTVNYVVYLTNECTVVLWDLYNAREIMRTQPPLMTCVRNGPIWFPDGTRFVIAQLDGYIEDLYVIDLTGKVEKLTDFGNQFEESSITNYHWSQDGLFVAFQATLSPDPCNEENENVGSYQANLNMTTKELSLYCIPEAGGYYQNSIWSPDGRYLLTSSYVDVSGTNINPILSTIVIDVSSDVVVKLIEGMYPVGWMTEPQE